MSRIGAVTAGGLIALTGLAVLGCGDDALAPPPARLATAIAIAEGDGQTGVAGSRLTRPFMIRVLDATGRGVGGVEVRWQVGSGVGFFHGVGQMYQTLQRSTADDGRLGVAFTPWTPGGLSVTAEATGLQGSPVIFAIEAERPGWWPALGTGAIYERLGTEGVPEKHDRFVLDGAGRVGVQSLFHTVFGSYSIEGDKIYFDIYDHGPASGSFRGDTLFVSFDASSDFEPAAYLLVP